MKKYLFLITILVLSLLFSFVYSTKEGYSNYYLANAQGDFPKAVETRMLSFYPSTGKLGISANDAQDIWWHYPDFKVGSYAQITNNIRYPNNPDDGTCTPASMCGALYKEKQVASNYIEPLPPVGDCPGARVNYYRTEPNMLAYKNNGNILY
jgi:hypothetical protein